MTGISISVPLLVLGLSLCFWFLLFDKTKFTAAAIFIALTAGFAVFGISLRLDKLVPILIIISQLKFRAKHGHIYLFLLLSYVLVNGMIQYRFWVVPSNLNLFYGEFRWLVQFLQYLITILLSTVITFRFSNEKGRFKLTKFLVIFTFISATAVFYQYVALSLGLPQIGLTRTTGEIQVASFSSQGQRVFRPGGIIGEPKALAATMQLFLIPWLFGCLGHTGFQKSTINYLGYISLLIFVLTFSTTGYVTFIVTICTVGLISGKIKIRRRSLTRFLVFTGAFVLGILILGKASMVIDLFSARFTDRISSFTQQVEDLDQLALRIWSTNWNSILFGFGPGGVSFPMIEILMPGFDYALAPNLGIITILCDTGLIGALFLMLSLLFPFLRIKAEWHSLSPNNRAVRMLGITFFLLWLVGSSSLVYMGIGVGLILIEINDC